MDYQLVHWLGEIGYRTGMTEISAQQTHALKAGPFGATTSWLVYHAESMDGAGLHTATLWRALPRDFNYQGWNEIEAD